MVVAILGTGSGRTQLFPRAIDAVRAWLELAGRGEVSAALHVGAHDERTLAELEHLHALTSPGRLLMSRAAADLARRAAVGDAGISARIEWIDHGSGICEAVPAGTPYRPLAIRDDTGSAWPRPDAPVPGRPMWMFDAKIRSDADLESWSIVHKKTGDRRTFTIARTRAGRDRLAGQVAAFQAGSSGHGSSRVLDWDLDRHPPFVEAEGGES